MYTLQNSDHRTLLKSLPNRSTSLIISNPPSMKSRRPAYAVIGEDPIYDKTSVGRKSVYELLYMCQPAMNRMNAYFFTDELRMRHYVDWAEKNNYSVSVLDFGNGVLLVRVYEYGTGLYHIGASDFSYTDMPKRKAMRPATILEKAILLSTDKGDLVVDPFSGIGETGVACVKHGRYFWGGEENPVLCAAALNRLNLLSNSIRYAN